MASNTTKKQAETKAAAQPEGEKKVRKQLTDAERVAKLEADLEAARNKAKAKAEKQVTALREARSKLHGKIAELQAKVNEINAELYDLGVVDDVTPADTEGAPSEDTSTEG